MGKTENAKPQRRHWRIWIGVASLLFVVWLAVMYGFFAYWMDRELREAMAEADRESPSGWQLEDIAAQREDVPDKENAAIVVLKVKSLLPGNWLAPGTNSGPEQILEQRLPAISPQVQLDDDLRDILRTSLSKVEPARAEARKLIGMKRGRFPLQYAKDIYMTTLQSQDARIAGILLRYEAALAAQDGNADGAVDFVRGLVGCGRSVGDEPTLVSALIRLACDAHAVAALERALAQGEPSSWQLETVQALLEKEAAEPIFVRGARGERAGLHKMLVGLRHGETSLAQLAGATGSIEKKVIDFSAPTLARRSHAYMLRLLNEYVAAAQLPPEKQPPVMNDLNRRVIQAKLQYDIVTALVMPAMMKVSDANRRGIGNLRSAYVAVAVERYRRDHGRCPDTLDALVPNYLAAVPTDPQDGNPLRFKRMPDGVVVYWLGFDGIDNGGKLNRLNNLVQGSDQGFQLWDVKQRRQPAREVLKMPREEP
jgi:hypothetical protein